MEGIEPPSATLRVWCLAIQPHRQQVMKRTAIRQVMMKVAMAALTVQMHLSSHSDITSSPKSRRWDSNPRIAGLQAAPFGHLGTTT